MKTFIHHSLTEAQTILNNFVSNEKQIAKIDQAIKMMVSSIRSGGKIMSCGNGGSMCDSMHFSEELTGRYRKDRKPIGAISITEPAHISCVANDYGYEFIFSRSVEALGRSGDILLAISTSGKSPNVLKACESAKALGMKIVGLSGKDGGDLVKVADTCIVVESAVTDRIQEIHIKIIHLMIEGIERDLFPENYN